MPQFEVTFAFEADSKEAVEFIVNRIVENHEPVCMSEITQVAPEDEVNTWDPLDDDEDDPLPIECLCSKCHNPESRCACG